MDMLEQYDLAIELWQEIKKSITENPYIPHVARVRDSFLMNKPVHWLHGCIFCDMYYDIVKDKCGLECPLAKYVGRIDTKIATLCGCRNTPYDIAQDTEAYLPHRLIACDRIINELKDAKATFEEEGEYDE